MQIIVKKWNMGYSLLQFDASKFVLEVRLYGGSVPNFNFFNVKPQIWQQNRKIHLSTCLDTIFRNISDICLRVIRRRNYK